MSYHSLDPREVNGKAVPVVRFGDDVIPYDPFPRLLGVHLDCQLTFRHHAEVTARNMQTRLKAVRCLTGRSWGCTTDSLV